MFVWFIFNYTCDPKWRLKCPRNFRPSPWVLLPYQTNFTYVLCRNSTSCPLPWCTWYVHLCDHQPLLLDIIVQLAISIQVDRNRIRKNHKKSRNYSSYFHTILPSRPYNKSQQLMNPCSRLYTGTRQGLHLHFVPRWARFPSLLRIYRNLHLTRKYKF